jgi:hypothetical protein
MLRASHRKRRDETHNQNSSERISRHPQRCSNKANRIDWLIASLLSLQTMSTRWQIENLAPGRTSR